VLFACYDAVTPLFGVGRWAPDPTDSRHCPGRTQAGWISRWRSLNHDIENGLCSLLWISLAKGTGLVTAKNLTKLKQEEPRPTADQTVAWLEGRKELTEIEEIKIRSQAQK